MQNVRNIPAPNDDTNEKDLAERIYRQIIYNEKRRNDGPNLYSPHWIKFDCALDKANVDKLHRIAMEADRRGELAQLNLRLHYRMNTPDIRLCLNETERNKTTLATINVYMLVVGKADPIERNLFLAENPGYRPVCP